MSESMGDDRKSHFWIGLACACALSSSCGSAASTPPLAPTWESLAPSVASNKAVRAAESLGWRIEGGAASAETFSGEAITVRPGVPVEVPYSRAGTLRFRTIVLPKAAGTASPEPWTFAIACGAEQVFSAEVHPTANGGGVAHAIALPDEPSERTLRFSVEGADALAAFAQPTLGPHDIGSYGKRPWKDTHPDVVLFSADTFRADNMHTLGGPGVTPHLDAFAGESAVFAQAWSSAPWTLPSHASLLTGLHPYQHGVVRGDVALPPDATTLAELFRDSGYRTAAVTDAIYVSRKHGLAQGFEVFHEEKFRPGRTAELVAEILAADDGRPLFLFVHSYRAHAPYLVSEDVRAQFGDVLRLDVDWGGLTSQLAANPWDLANADEVPSELLDLLASGQRLYQGGASDLDRIFGQVRDQLEQRGLWEHAFVAFTGDHGEAFGEHATLLHGEGVWQEEVHVPFLLRGPGIAAGVRGATVDSTAVAPTLAELARLSRPTSWEGRSALERTQDDPTFTFGCYAGHERWTFAVRSGPRKLVLRGHAGDTDPELIAAFDLEVDPLETAVELPAWAHDELDPLRPVLREATTPRLEPIARETVTDEERQQLRALGYGD